MIVASKSNLQERACLDMGASQVFYTIYVFTTNLCLALVKEVEIERITYAKPSRSLELP